MNKVNLKCGGFVYIEPFGEGEEDDRCKIYDDNMNYWDYIDVGGEEILAHARYDEQLKYFEQLEDIHNYLGAVLYSYTCGKTIEDLIDNVCLDDVLYYTDEEIEEEKQQMLDYLEKHGEEAFCTNYLINKIGGLFISYED